MDEKLEQQQRLLREPVSSDATSSRDSSELSEKSFVRQKRELYLRTTARRLKQTTCWLYVLASAYLLTVVIFGFLYVRLRNDYRECRRLDLFPSLAREPGVIQFKRMKLPVKMFDNPFVGNPSDKLDHAWHQLFEDVNIRVTAEDLTYAELESLELADGSGDYIGQLGVHHELHCLKRVRRWIYRDHYYPNLTEAEFTENKVHIDHCIELLRVTIMCRADTSISTFNWLEQLDGSAAVTETRDVAYHSCVNYDRLMRWVRARSLDLFDPNLLMPPPKLSSKSQT